jgi:hypothetical protein
VEPEDEAADALSEPELEVPEIEEPAPEFLSP